MIHPLFTKLASKPGLFAEHIGAYAELAAAEARQFGAHWQTRLTLAALSVVTGAIALVVSAIAGMLIAVHGWNHMVAPWVLVIVPGLLWLLATCSGLFAWQAKVSPVFSLVREQMEADIELLNQAGNP